MHTMLTELMPIEEIKIGMKASYSQAITDHDIRTFAKLSGDHNPIHINDDYIKLTRFRRRVVHGLIPVSFFSGLFGTKIPGPGCLYVSQTINFKKPIYIDDTVTATVEVSAIDIANRHVFFKTSCTVNGKVVISGEADIFIPKDVFK